MKLLPTEVWNIKYCYHMLHSYYALILNPNLIMLLGACRWRHCNRGSSQSRTCQWSPSPERAHETVPPVMLVIDNVFYRLICCTGRKRVRTLTQRHIASMRIERRNLLHSGWTLVAAGCDFLSCFSGKMLRKVTRIKSRNLLMSWVRRLQISQICKAGRHLC